MILCSNLPIPECRLIPGTLRAFGNGDVSFIRADGATMSVQPDGTVKWHAATIPPGSTDVTVGATDGAYERARPNGGALAYCYGLHAPAGFGFVYFPQVPNG